MPPSLPSRPSKDVDRISASWLCRLLDCVAYGMTHPCGDGNTILNQPGGTLRALRQPGGGTDGGSYYYSGPFALEKSSATEVKVRGYSIDVDVSIDSPLIIDMGSGAGYLVNETTIAADRTLPYICLDWWWDIATNIWVHAIVASSAWHPVEGEYVNYPAELERVSRRILGKEKWTYANSAWSLTGVTQWHYGAITASMRTY